MILIKQKDLGNKEAALKAECNLKAAEGESRSSASLFSSGRESTNFHR